MSAKDISDVTLKDLQDEVSPRISARDLTNLMSDRPESVFVIDLRSPSEYRRAHLEPSLNIPFASVQLGETRLETLNVVDLGRQMAGRIVVVISCVSENDILVRVKIQKIVNEKH